MVCGAGEGECGGIKLEFFLAILRCLIEVKHFKPININREMLKIRSEEKLSTRLLRAEVFVVFTKEN